MKHLYFVRHGESEANVNRTYSGQAETPLTAKGREQAKLAGAHAKDFQIDHIVSSPLSRARDTAIIIAEAIDFPIETIELNSLLLERGFGSIVGMSWDSDVDVDGTTDVETIDEVLERARLAYEYLQSLPYDNVLIASHGTFGWALRATINPELRDIPENESAGIPNAQIVRFV